MKLSIHIKGSDSIGLYYQIFVTTPSGDEKVIELSDIKDVINTTSSLLEVVDNCDKDINKILDLSSSQSL